MRCVCQRYTETGFMVALRCVYLSPRITSITRINGIVCTIDFILSTDNGTVIFFLNLHYECAVLLISLHFYSANFVYLQVKDNLNLDLWNNYIKRLVC